MVKHQTVVFNADTREVIRRAEARTWVVLLTFMVLLVAASLGLGHHEFPILDYRMGSCSPDAVLSDCTSRGSTSLLIGIASAVLLVPLAVVIHRRRPIRPTITCNDCGGRGWVMDLEPRNGRCPRCAHQYFTYRTFAWGPVGVLGGIHQITEHGMAGTDLIDRFHRTRRSAMTRYY